jgi:ATP-dependent NAD(P)H-hydrate dehydratase
VPLSETSHKGSSGRVGVVGGSAKYTGAPYYAAMASLKVGADLVTCFTATEATIPIKCYSPELMVMPVYTATEFDEVIGKHQQKQQQQRCQGQSDVDDDNSLYDDNEVQQLVSNMVKEVSQMMDKLHVLVIGPGLGRCPIVLEATSQIIQTARSPPYNLPLVLDADALYLLTLPRYQNVLSLLESPSSSLPSSSTVCSSPPVVLTPNVMERKRLDESNVVLPTDGSCFVIEKGQVDQIKQATKPTNDGSDNVSLEVKMTCGETGGLKRSGGIGDILAGTCGTLLAWNRILSSRNVASSSSLSSSGTEDVPLACWTACCFVKRSTKRAFDVHRRSMTAPDILHELGPTIDDMMS